MLTVRYISKPLVSRRFQDAFDWSLIFGGENFWLVTVTELLLSRLFACKCLSPRAALLTRPDLHVPITRHLNRHQTCWRYDCHPVHVSPKVIISVHPPPIYGDQRTTSGCPTSRIVPRPHTFLAGLIHLVLAGSGFPPHHYISQV